MKLYSFLSSGQPVSTAVPLYHLKRKLPNGKINITGYWKDISVGSLFQFESSRAGSKYDFYQIEKISYRDHMGKFNSPVNAKNSFFDSECILINADKILKDVTHVNDIKLDRVDKEKMLVDALPKQEPAHA